MIKTCEEYGHRPETVTISLKIYKPKTKIAMKTINKIVMVYGVPQGRILGPLQFIFYLNEIRRFFCKSYVDFYEDDNIILDPSSNYKEVAECIDRELHILTWLCLNMVK